MSVDGFSNAYSTTLNGSITNVATSLIVTTATGAPSTVPFRLRLKAEGTNTTEIVTVTAVSGTTYTITRASESYAGVQTASAHDSGAVVEHVLTAGGLMTLAALVFLGSTTLGADASTADVTGLSAAYKDLIIVISARSAAVSVSDDLWLRVGNGSIDTGTSYTYLGRYHSTSVTTFTTSNSTNLGVWLGVMAGANAVAGFYSGHSIEIIDYTSARMREVFGKAHFQDGTTTFATDISGTWKNATSAIDSVRIYAGAGNLKSGTKIMVYGRG